MAFSKADAVFSNVGYAYPGVFNEAQSFDEVTGVALGPPVEYTLLGVWVHPDNLTKHAKVGPALKPDKALTTDQIRFRHARKADAKIGSEWELDVLETCWFEGIK